MSDTKPKRAAREPARSEVDADDAITAATASVIEQNTQSQAATAATTALPPPVPALSAAADAAPAADDAAIANAWTAFAEAQAALAHGFEKAAVEATGISRSGMAAMADAVVALLGARTYAEAIEINAGLARRGVDAMLEGSARLSEIGAQAVANASRPLLSRFGGTWSALGGG
jgi:hypothetical protein